MCLQLPYHPRPVPPKTLTKAPGKKAAVDDAYFAEQPPDTRALLLKVRALVAKAVPDATVSIKWGVPIYARNGKNVCALASFKEAVQLEPQNLGYTEVALGVDYAFGL